MATQYRVPTRSIWGGRTLEWVVILGVLGGVVGVFSYQSRQLQAQAELAAVQSTLGSLRTTLVLDHLQKTVQTAAGMAPVATKQHNPFKVLRFPPGNYAGEKSMSQIMEVPAGSWVFDPVCRCIGYRPIHPEWIEPANDPLVLWYKVVEPSGVMEVEATAPYRWMGMAVY